MANSSFSSFTKGRKAELPVPSKKKEDDTNKPRNLEGWLEKKGQSKMGMSGDWQKRYIRINESASSLTYSKSSNLDEKASGVIDLTLAKEITMHDKAGGKKGVDRFDIDVGDRVFKFKAANDKEGQKWVEGLNEWREYFLMNM
jgi:hypothetical protein